jgi:hypothetical protein
LRSDNRASAMPHKFKIGDVIFYRPSTQHNARDEVSLSKTASAASLYDWPRRRRAACGSVSIELEFSPHYFGSGEGNSSSSTERTTSRPSRVTTMNDLRTAMIRSHRRNIQRYSRLLATSLSDLERQYLHKRIADEHAELERWELNSTPPQHAARTPPDPPTQAAPNPPRSAG